MVAVIMIFVQIYLNLMGALNGDHLISYILLAFYFVRLVQYLLKTSLAVNMAQSNFMCLSLALMGTFSYF